MIIESNQNVIVSATTAAVDAHPKRTTSVGRYSSFSPCTISDRFIYAVNDSIDDVRRPDLMLRSDAHGTGTIDDETLRVKRFFVIVLEDVS